MHPSLSSYFRGAVSCSHARVVCEVGACSRQSVSRSSGTAAHAPPGFEPGVVDRSRRSVHCAWCANASGTEARARQLAQRSQPTLCAPRLVRERFRNCSASATACTIATALSAAPAELKLYSSQASRRARAVSSPHAIAERRAPWGVAPMAMSAVGFEPTRSCLQWILSPPP